MKCDKNSQKCSPKDKVEPVPPTPDSGGAPNYHPATPATPGTYGRPRFYNDAGNKGDIYIVTKDDHDANPSYVEGDLLILLQDKPANASWNYPYRGTSDSHWKYAWDRCVKYNLTLYSLPVNTAKGSIYGNGLNQAAILISVQPEDDGSSYTGQKTKFNLPQNVVQASVKLIDWSSGTSLSAEWQVSDKANDYQRWLDPEAGVSTDDPSKHQHEAPLLEEVQGPGGYELYNVALCYVTCSKQSSLNFGVIITTSTGNEFVISYATTQNPPATITAQNPISYTLSNTTLITQNWQSGWQIQEGETEVRRDDYYFYISDTSNYWIKNVEPKLESGETQMWCVPNYWSLKTTNNNKDANALFIWWWPSQSDTPQSAVINPLLAQGLDNPITISGNYLSSNIPAVGFTAIRYQSSNTSGADTFYETHFIIYDQYGNSGLFAAVRNAQDEYGTLRIEEGDHTSGG